MVTRSIAVAICATLFVLLLPGTCNCFAPAPGIIISSISSTSTTFTRTIIQENNSMPPRCATTRTTATLLPMSRNNNNEIKGPADRALSCLPYLLPLLDGERYGRYLFYSFPLLGQIDALLLGPFKIIYGSVPFAQFIAFIGLSVLSRNPELSRPVRFNMQQALLLDIALIIPSLLQQIPIPMPAVVANSGSNFVFYVLVASVGYSIVSNVTGKVPNKIPIVSEAAESSTGF